MRPPRPPIANTDSGFSADIRVDATCREKDLTARVDDRAAPISDDVCVPGRVGAMRTLWRVNRRANRDDTVN